jgi:hypothetical protein
VKLVKVAVPFWRTSVLVNVVTPLKAFVPPASRVCVPGPRTKPPFTVVLVYSAALSPLARIEDRPRFTVAASNRSVPPLMALKAAAPSAFFRTSWPPCAMTAPVKVAALVIVLMPAASFSTRPAPERVDANVEVPVWLKCRVPLAVTPPVWNAPAAPPAPRLMVQPGSMVV